MDLGKELERVLRRTATGAVFLAAIALALIIIAALIYAGIGWLLFVICFLFIAYFIGKAVELLTDD